jgi:hypothetical protein
VDRNIAWGFSQIPDSLSLPGVHCKKIRDGFLGFHFCPSSRLICGAGDEERLLIG